jgi:hypothetical protein
VKARDRAVLYSCLALLIFIAFELTYICDKIGQGWPGVTK